LTVWSYHRIRPTRCRTGWCPRNIDSTTRTLISITLCIYLNLKTSRGVGKGNMSPSVISTLTFFSF